MINKFSLIFLTLWTSDSDSLVPWKSDSLSQLIYFGNSFGTIDVWSCWYQFGWYIRQEKLPTRWVVGWVLGWCYSSIKISLSWSIRYLPINLAASIFSQVCFREIFWGQFTGLWLIEIPTLSVETFFSKVSLDPEMTDTWPASHVLQIQYLASMNYIKCVPCKSTALGHWTSPRIIAVADNGK